MSNKGLEALRKIKFYAMCNYADNKSIIDECEDVIEKELHRLEAISNVNLSEALECLDKLEECAEGMKDLPKSNWSDLAEDEAELDMKIIDWAETINFELFKGEQLKEENELLKEIIKSLFDRGCPLHQYMDNKRGLTIEVDDECSIMQLGEFKGVDLDKKLKEVLGND